MFIKKDLKAFTNVKYTTNKLHMWRQCKQKQINY